MSASVPPAHSWADWVSAKNAKARAKNRWRRLEVLDAGTARVGELVVFSSNDYLGLSGHPKVKAAAIEAVERWGTGAGSARLLGGTRPVHEELETALAAWKSAERALLFPSGYAANLGVISALAGPGTLICTDELNHASIVDGCRLARSTGSEISVFPHGDVAVLHDLLDSWPGRCAVVTDAVFSMDGDQAPLAEIEQLCARRGALLVVDEAHSVLGPSLPQPSCETVRVGTLSKTLGSQGGFVAGGAALVDMLVNRSRPFIFTTALAPASAAAALGALEILRSPEGEGLLARLEGHCATVAPQRGWLSPIVPVMVGTEQEALDAAAALRAQGLYVPAVRPPTVPPGGCRLRVSLSAAHTSGEVSRLTQALGDLGLAPGPPGGRSRRRPS